MYIYSCRWIKPPHPKIALCFCKDRRWVFFFNSDSAIHGIAQVEVDIVDHPAALIKKCYLNLSQTLCVSLDEAESAEDKGEIGGVLRDKIQAVLSNPIKTLPDNQRLLALKNLCGN